MMTRELKLVWMFPSEQELREETRLQVYLQKNLMRAAENLQVHISNRKGTSFIFRSVKLLMF